MAVRATAAIAMLMIGIAAVAYAAASPRKGEAGAERDRATGPAPLLPPAARPRILFQPEAVTTSSTATFRFAAEPRRPRFQCRLDRGEWRPCASPATYGGIAPGAHVFRVKVRTRRRPLSRSGRAYWLVVEPREFSITPLFSGLDPLYPGAAAMALPVRLDNPNPLPITVTEVRVAVTRGPGGCDPATNLELTPAGISGTHPLALPAGGSASIPAVGFEAPSIRMLDLPFSQDACRGASFSLDFSGQAHG